MTQELLHPALVPFKPNQSYDRQARTQMRTDADSMLREIAFVLKMTQRVCDEIEAEREIQEPLPE